LYTPAAGNNIPGDVHALPVVFGSQTLAAVIGVVEYLTADVHVGSTLRHATGDGTQVPGAKDTVTAAGITGNTGLAAITTDQLNIGPLSPPA